MERVKAGRTGRTGGSKTLQERRYTDKHDLESKKIIEMVQINLDTAMCPCCGQRTPVRKYRYVGRGKGRVRRINDQWMEGHHLTYLPLLSFLLPAWMRYVPLCVFCHRGSYGDRLTNEEGGSKFSVSVAHSPDYWIVSSDPNWSRNTIGATLYLLVKFWVLALKLKRARKRQ